MRWLTKWFAIAGASAVSVNAAAQGPLKQLRLEPPPTQTLFCSVGEQVQLSLVGMDEKQTRTSLEPYKIRIRSSNPGVASAQGRGPTWAAIDAVCKADGDAWILVDANGVRAWMRVLVGSARAAPAAVSGPPESVWTEALASGKLAPAGTISSPTLQTRTMISRTLTVTPVATIALSATPAAIEQGSTQAIVATPRDAAGAALAGRAVAWQSSKPAVASVDANGVVTAVEVGGPATITATSEAASASATVSVSAIRPSNMGGQMYATAPQFNLGPGQMQQIRDYFAVTGDNDRWYLVHANWQQPSGCTAGAAIGPPLAVRLSSIPAGRQYQLSLKRDHTTVLQESQPSGQDQSLSINGTCGGSGLLYVQIHKSSGLPSSTPFTLTLSLQGP
jgi:hypothetical protein